MRPLTTKVRVTDGRVLLVVAGYALSFVVFGLVMDGPVTTFHGVIDIMTSRDVLITDYIVLGGMGAAFANAGLLTLIACGIYRLARARMDGAAVACLFLVLGFALFGKNLLNVWPGVAGTYLYALHQREPFAKHINTAFFGAALAPLFSEVLFSTEMDLAPRIALAIVTSVVVGYVLPPIAKQLFRSHDGYTLYNMGFTAGMVGTIVMAVYKSYGFVAQPVMLWSTGHDVSLGVFLGVLFASMAVIAFLVDPHSWGGFRSLVRMSGRSPSDFLHEVGAGPTLLNMAITGGMGTAYVLVVGGDLNGPVVGAIFSIVGFAAFGKHAINIASIMLGVFIASLTKPWNVTDPSIIFAALFGTTLAPIPGKFGPVWGVVAGIVHSSVVLTVGALHAGLNLYNNGFASGIVASLLVPVIIAVSGRGRRARSPGGPRQPE